jgi:hypothetical protein
MDKGLAVKDLVKLGATREAARSIVHREKFQGGRMTPQEFHQRYAFARGAKCHVCTRRPLTTARTYIPLEDLHKQDPEGLGALLVQSPDKLQGMMETFRDASNNPVQYVRISTTYACRQHRKELEIAAAKGPSWAVVEFNHGPGEDRIIVGGPLSSAPSAVTHG